MRRLRRHQGSAEHGDQRVGGGAQDLVGEAGRLLAAVHDRVELLERRHVGKRRAARIAAVLAARGNLP